MKCWRMNELGDPWALLKMEELDLPAANGDQIKISVEAADLNLLDGAVKNSVQTAKCVVYGDAGEVQANTLDLGNWTITEAGSELKFAYGGTNKFKITSSGAIVAENDVTAFGSA